jgi:hypothetical protein
MRVVIEIQSGLRAGHKILLREPQIMVFGRTEWADVVFEHDASMSPKHFSLQVQGGRVHLCDLGSESGTTVNQHAVNEAWVGDGDTIVAGQTRFAIWIDGEGNEPEAQPDLTADRPTTLHDPAGPPIQPGTINCTREPCGAGLMRLRGIVGEPALTTSAPMVAVALEQHYPLTILVDPQLVDQPQLGTLPDAVALFDWLPDAQARCASPLLLPPGSCPDASALIGAGWDKNGLLCIFSRQPTDVLIQHLRSAIRWTMSPHAEDGAVGASGEEPASRPVAAEPEDQSVAAETTAQGTPPQSLLGYCWPNVLSTLVDCGQPAYVRRLFQPMDVVLLEVPEQSGSWQAVAHEELAEALAKIGFHTADSEMPPATRPDPAQSER